MLLKSLPISLREAGFFYAATAANCCLPVQSNSTHTLTHENVSYIGDVDGDGQLDIAAIAGWVFGTIAVLTRNENTTLAGDNSCTSADSDPDGDGWGWENGQSCEVTEQSQQGGNNSGGGNQDNSNAGGTTTPTLLTQICASASSDPDGDGWGWENNASCIVGGNSNVTDSEANTRPCARDSSDPDGDGWGWEDNMTCQVVP